MAVKTMIENFHQAGIQLSQNKDGELIVTSLYRLTPTQRDLIKKYRKALLGQVISVEELRSSWRSIVSYVSRWTESCQPSDEFQVPSQWIWAIRKLKEIAEKKVRMRHRVLWVWSNTKNELCCKLWFGPEPRKVWKKPLSRTTTMGRTANEFSKCGTLKRVGSHGIQSARTTFENRLHSLIEDHP
mgnify:CR=1 FL=1